MNRKRLNQSSNIGSSCSLFSSYLPSSPSLSFYFSLSLSFAFICFSLLSLFSRLTLSLPARETHIRSFNSRILFIFVCFAQYDSTPKERGERMFECLEAKKRNAYMIYVWRYISHYPCTTSHSIEQNKR
jgi:hypothetical protein